MPKNSETVIQNPIEVNLQTTTKKSQPHLKMFRHPNSPKGVLLSVQFLTHPKSTK